MRYKLLSVFLMMSIYVYGQNYSWEDPRPILESKDSIILKSDESGSLYIDYQLKSYQSIYRVGNFFGQSLATINEFNGQAPQHIYQEGDHIRIPIDSSYIITDFFKRSLFKKYAKVYYEVQPKETLFKLTKRIFNIPAKVIQRRNRLNSDQISVGQLLRIGWFPEEGLYEPVTTKEMLADGMSWKELDADFAEAKHKNQLLEEKGVAYWNTSKKGGDEFFVMHKTAAVDSYIELTNPMFGKKIFAKVVGRIPPNAFPSEVIAVLSPAAAIELGAKDARFFVKMRYLQRPDIAEK